MLPIALAFIALPAKHKDTTECEADVDFTLTIPAVSVGDVLATAYMEQKASD